MGKCDSENVVKRRKNISLDTTYDISLDRTYDYIQLNAHYCVHRRTQDFTMEGFTWWGPGQSVRGTEVSQWGPGAKPQ